MKAVLSVSAHVECWIFDGKLCLSAGEAALRELGIYGPKPLWAWRWSCQWSLRGQVIPQHDLIKSAFLNNPRHRGSDSSVSSILPFASATLGAMATGCLPHAPIYRSVVTQGCTQSKDRRLVCCPYKGRGRNGQPSTMAAPRTRAKAPACVWPRFDTCASAAASQVMCPLAVQWHEYKSRDIDRRPPTVPASRCLLSIEARWRAAG